MSAPSRKTVAVTKGFRRIALPACFALLAGTPPVTGQDAWILAAEARAFLGEWSVILEGPEGPVELRFDLADDRGQLLGIVQGWDGSTILAEEITMSGSDLLLSYRMDYRGEGFRVALSLSPDTLGLAVTLAGGGGAFTLTGTGVRILSDRPVRTVRPDEPHS